MSTTPPRARLVDLHAGAFVPFVPPRQLTARPRAPRTAATSDRPPPQQPERALLVALLAGAVFDLTTTQAREDMPAAELRAAARAWVDGAAAPFTFADCCDGLGIDVGAARAALASGAAQADRGALLVSIGLALHAA